MTDAVPTPPAISTLGELKAAGYEYKTVREELRDNLIAKLRRGEKPWPGLHGLEHTVLPQVERAIIAGHDIVLLGERGQGKTRLLRTLPSLLDAYVPAVAGSELREHPLNPLTDATKRRIEEEGDATPIEWIPREARYSEKLATPDTSVADLIGDVDPMRVAEGRRLGDPETIHYGLIPRSNRGVVAINELPDLAERIQVAMLNVMEEADIQIRGYMLRLPLDVLVVASANPEDYTNRGRIITPLKDRFGAEIRTHYPVALEDEIHVIEQESQLTAVVPAAIMEALARFTRALRESDAVNQRAGVSARFAIAGAETVAASAARRAAITGEDPVARLVDLEAAVDVLGGKVEFEHGEEDRAWDILEYLLRNAVAHSVRNQVKDIDFAPLIEALDGSTFITTGENLTAAEFLAGLPPLEGSLYDDIANTFGAETQGERAAAIELAVEALYLTQKISKDSGEGETIYG